MTATAEVRTGLDQLEAEAVHIFREALGQFERPVLLFSGGKDSIVMLELALRAFAPAPLPYGLLHIDTGHNFPEALTHRDRVVDQYGSASASCPSPSTWRTAASGSARTVRATSSRRSRCWTPSRPDATAPRSAAAVATRGRPAPRNGCSRSATRSASGTPPSAPGAVVALQRPPPSGGRGTSREGADACIRYLTGHADRLHYDTALACGWPIATGAIKGACRHIIADRLAITGSRWGLAGSETTLKLRALKDDGDFEEYWRHHLTREHGRLYPTPAHTTTASQPERRSSCKGLRPFHFVRPPNGTRRATTLR